MDWAPPAYISVLEVLNQGPQQGLNGTGWGVGGGVCLSNLASGPRFGAT